jgi:hypothetical protein
VKCTRAGWTCSYPDPKPVKTVKTLLAPISRYAIPFKVPGSQKDRQVLHYYCVQGSGELAGWFNLDFWSRVVSAVATRHDAILTAQVLQQSHQEPVVRQALVSLGMLHLEFTTTSRDTAGVEVLTQYGRTLRMLKRRLDNADAGAMKTALICCILFCCFEAACNNYNGATGHLQNGLNLLSNFHDDPDLDVLTRMIGGLDVQASLLNDSRPPQLESDILPDTTTITTTFPTLDEAYQMQTKLKSGLLHSLMTAMPQNSPKRGGLPVPDKKDALAKQVDLWWTRFEHFKTTEAQETGAQILRFHHKVASMFLDGSSPANSARVFGSSPNTRAQEILDLAEDVLRRSEGGSRRSLSIETGVVAPLFAMAMQCSDDHVRTRALGLLDSLDRREGLYDTQGMIRSLQEFMAARYGERLVLNEQSSNELLIRHLDFS